MIENNKGDKTDPLYPCLFKIGEVVILSKEFIKMRNSLLPNKLRPNPPMIILESRWMQMSSFDILDINSLYWTWSYRLLLGDKKKWIVEMWLTRK